MSVPAALYFPLARGVYRSGAKVRRRWVYFAIASDGLLLEMWRAAVGQWDAEVISALGILLKLEDPPARNRARFKVLRPIHGRSCALAGHPVRPSISSPRRLG